MLKHLLTLAAAALLAAPAYAQEPATETVKFADVADTWIRSNNENWNGKADEKLEIRKDAITEGEGENKTIVGYSNFVGLIGFEYSVPEGMRVQKATLHFVTERKKSAELVIRGYNHDFAEDCGYKHEKEYIAETLAKEPLFKGEIAGHWNKAVFDNGLDEAHQVLAGWENNIDVTAYVAAITGDRVNFLFTQDKEESASCQQICIYSKENKGFNNTNYAGFTATAEECTPYLEVVFVEDTDKTTEKILSSADTYVRTNNQNDRGKENQMEIAKKEDGTHFDGIMQYTLPAAIFDTEKYEINSVSLRLVTKQCKGDRAIVLRAISNDVNESYKYNDIKDWFEQDLLAEPFAEFSIKGQMNKSCYDNGVTQNTIEDWTNTIDLTEYVKSIVAAAEQSRALTANTLAFAISKKNNHNDSMKFYTKEATDENNDATGVHFAAEDLKPYLTVTYTKKEEPTPPVTGIEDIAADENAPVEYYSINGIRMNGDNLAPGLYIKRQGSKATKILVK